MYIYIYILQKTRHKKLLLFCFVFSIPLLPVLRLLKLLVTLIYYLWYVKYAAGGGWCVGGDAAFYGHFRTGL